MFAGLTVLNMIKEATAASMQQSMYQASLYAGNASKTYTGYNMVTGREITAGPASIICGRSCCGSEENGFDEFCKKR